MPVWGVRTRLDDENCYRVRCNACPLRVTNRSGLARASMSQVPQKADGIGAVQQFLKAFIGDKLWGGSLPCGSGHALLRRGAAEPLRISALRVSIVAAEPVERGGRSFEPFSLRWADLHPKFHYRPTVLGALKDKPYRARKCASLTAPPRGRNGSASSLRRSGCKEK